MRLCIENQRVARAILVLIGSIIPEPDAPALLQALFIMLALGLWLRTRRTA